MHARLSSRNSMLARAVPGRGNRVLRQIDKYVGAPAVFCLGALRRRKPLPERIGRVGLLNTAAIGDTILMSAPLADLRSTYQDAEIVLLVGPSNYEAAHLLSGADMVVKLPVFDPFSSIREIREQNFDLLLDFGPWARLNAILSALSQAKFTAGFRTKKQYRHYAYDVAADHSSDVHELDNYRRLLSAINIAAGHRPCIAKRQIRLTVDEECNEPYLVFHLWPGGTAGKLKQWPPERWVKLAEHFAERGYQIVLTGGSSQRPANDEIIAMIDRNRHPSVLNRAGLSLTATSALILGSALVVSVDTGVMHLAAALDVPLVALMGPASRRRWGPVSAFASVLESPLNSCCYLDLGFEVPSNPPKCMEAISFDAVRAACEEALLSARTGALDRAPATRFQPANPT